MRCSQQGTSRGKTKADEEILKRYREYQKALTILTARLEAHESMAREPQAKESLDQKAQSQETLAREALAQETPSQKPSAQKVIPEKAFTENAPSPRKKDIQEQIEQIRQSLREKEQEYNRFIEEIKPQNPELASLISVVTPPIEDIQKRLDKDTTLIEYYTAKDKTYVWLLARNDIRVFELSPDRDTLKEEVNNFNLLLPGGSRTRRLAPHILKTPTNTSTKASSPKWHKEREEHFLKKCRQFYTTLFAPFAKGIKTQKLIIVPHGVLHKLPFAALADAEGYLTDRYQISLLPSASSLCHLKQKAPSKNRLLAFANPYINDYIDSQNNRPLVHAEEEVAFICALFKEKPEVYKDAGATETRLKQRSTGSDIIHIAAHGEFYEKQPLLSCIYLTKDHANDGPLQVHEVFNLDLPDARLVTLSACNTGLCRIQGGDDMVGLSQGFFYAGTPSLLATLWEVNDKSTSIFMEYFYKNWLNGMSKPEALRQAQLQLRKSESYSHPYRWAPFVLFGE